ncbi:MAG: site-2 protease family protein [Pyrinomonadaceae bacterium]
MGAELLGHLAIYLVVLIFAISAHEAGHAWMSYKFGDDTAYLLGRVTLDPRAHTDPIGTLLIPIISFVFASQGLFLPLLGWGKPTPVNPLRWRRKDLANVMVSLAGIMANLIIASGGLVVIKGLQFSGVWNGTMFGFREPITLLLIYTLTMNVSLAVFNLLPFPPLDGSHVLETFLPASARPFFELLEQYGFIILMVFIYLGFINIMFTPVMYVIAFLLVVGT